MTGVVYDANGNVPHDNQGAANAFDADGKAVELGGVPVTFDALGRAVDEGSGIQEFAYAPGGAKLAVMNTRWPLSHLLPRYESHAKIT